MNPDLILKNIGTRNPGAFVLQIGAMDGVSFDDIRPYIEHFKWTGLFVEPIPEMFARLTSGYSRRPGMIFENSAISDFTGTIDMIRIPPSVVDRGIVHACYDGMSAVWPPRNGLGSEADRETVEKYGEKITVPCMTMDDLLLKHSVETIDMLVIDAEGHDWHIFKQLDLLRFRPTFIKIEYINLIREEADELIAKLEQFTYRHTVIGQDLYAVPAGMEADLCGHSDIQIGSPPCSSNVTIVTGIWDFEQEESTADSSRHFSHYLDHFEELCRLNIPMLIYAAKPHQHLIKLFRENRPTVLQNKHLSSFRENFDFFDAVQDIRKNPSWSARDAGLNVSKHGAIEWYNPMTMSKIFMLNDARIGNPFNSDYYVWLDCTILRTVPLEHLANDKTFHNMASYLQTFFFLTVPSGDAPTLHGFPRKDLARLCNRNDIPHICSGQFFGGHRDCIGEINGHYYSWLSRTLRAGLMGTEACVFTLLANNTPELCRVLHLGDESCVDIAAFFRNLGQAANM